MIVRVTVFIVLCSFLLSVSAFPQDTSSARGVLNFAAAENSYQQNQASFTDTPAVAVPGIETIIVNLPGDWARWQSGYVVTSKFILPLAVITISTAALMRNDHQMWEPLDKEFKKNGAMENIKEASVFLGDGKFQFGISAAFGAAGLIAGNKRAMRTSVQTAEAILATGAIVQLIKHVTGRERPEANTSEMGVWRFFPDQIEYHKHVPSYDAFPSGHLATATTTLTVIMENYPEAKWIPYVGYPLLGALSVGLVAKGMHWWSDYPLAIFLGYTMGKTVTVGNNKSVENVHNNTRYVPEIGVTMMQSGSPGVSFTWKL